MQIIGGASRGQMLQLIYSVKNLSQGVTDGQLHTVVSDAEVFGYTAPWRGRVAAIAYALHGPINSGTVTVGFSQNLVEDPDTTLTLTAGATRGFYRVPRWKTKFASGDLIGAQYTTSHDYSGNSTDLLVSVYVIYDIGEI